ncbi:MAG: hypothetical protein F6J95_015905 [Leptolyngbya sp. SIO1E4]|nr:hypothetical protein [Leptolyngbya sp. SIO1E4]
MTALNSFNTSTVPRQPRNRFQSQQLLMFGKKDRARVVRDILPERRGRISWSNTTWFAISNDNLGIPAGTVVELLAREGNTWLVKAVTDENVSSSAA